MVEYINTVENARKDEAYLLSLQRKLAEGSVFSVYQVVFKFRGRMRGRRGLAEERFLREAGFVEPLGDVAERPFGKAMLAFKGSRTTPFVALGTFAVDADREWSQVGELAERQRLREFTRTLAQSRYDQRFEDRLKDLFLQAEATWLPVFPVGDRLPVIVGMISGSADSRPKVAVYLSAAYGVRFGFLQECNRCEALYIADPPARRCCDSCHWIRTSMPESKRRVWEPVKDRLRKRYPNRAERERVSRQAEHDLQKMPWEEWQANWDQRRGNQGRPRKER